MAMFTSLHGQHSVAWTIPGFTLPTVCIACMMERLENKRELTTRISKILTELKTLLGEGRGKSKLIEVLESDKRVLERMCGHLFGLFVSQEITIVHLSMEVILMIINLTRDDTLALKLIHTAIKTIMVSQSFPGSLPHLTFLGKMLHSNTSLCSVLTQSYSNFLEFMIGGLTYPDDSIKSSVVYVLVQLCKKGQANSLSLPLVQNMCQNVSTNLATAKSQELTINLLGLVRHILRSGTYTQCLLQADRIDSEAKGSTFASAFKRVLLSRDELMQLSAVQCVEEVLLHHMDYGRVLLRSDIAEFMFEALSSKNELLISSLFSCLNSLTSVDEFYTKCHVLYGMEPVMIGLTTSMKLRAHSTTETGFSLLRNILTNQPAGMRLFPTHSSLKKILDIIHMGLKVKSEVVTLQATTALTSLLSSEHLPPGLPLSLFLSPLAVLLHLIESLTTPIQVGVAKEAITLTSCEQFVSKKTSDQFHQVLMTFKKICNLAEETHKSSDDSGGLVLKEEDIIFLSRAVEDSLLPVVLLNMDSVEDPEIFTCLFSLTSSNLSISSPSGARIFARKLVRGGFIHLVFEIKMKFLTSEGYKELSCSGNHLLVSMCVCLEKMDEKESDAVSASFVKNTLQHALPKINCSFESCLQYLNQKAPSTLYQRTLGHVTTESGSLSVLQHATLILLQYACCHDNRLMPPRDMLWGLYKYLSLNPGIHLFPPVILISIVRLFSSVSKLPLPLEWILDATQLLVQGLQRIPDPAQLCIGQHPDLLQWLFDQPSLRTSLSKTLLIQCLWSVSSSNNPDTTGRMVKVLETSSPARQCLMRLLVGEESIPMDLVLNLLQLLILKETQQSEVSSQVIHTLQEMVAVPRMDPISDLSMVGILQLISTALDSSSGEGPVDLKIIYKVTSLVSKAEVGSTIAKHGMDIIRKILQANKDDIHISTLFLSDLTFLNRVSLFLHELATPKLHTVLSASALHLLSILIDLQFHHNIKVTQFPKSILLQAASPISALSAPLREAQIAGLEFWEVLFHRGGRTGFVTIENDNDDTIGDADDHGSGQNRMKMVLFLVLNCLLSEDHGVRKSASGCLVETMKYMKTSHGTSKLGLHWINLTLSHLVDTYHSSTLPPLYVTSILAVLRWMSDPTDCPRLKALSQLLYKSYLSLPLDHSPDIRTSFLACFTEIRGLNTDTLDTDQWANIKI